MTKQSITFEVYVVSELHLLVSSQFLNLYNITDALDEIGTPVECYRSLFVPIDLLIYEEILSSDLSDCVHCALSCPDYLSSVILAFLEKIPPFYKVTLC